MFAIVEFTLAKKRAEFNEGMIELRSINMVQAELLQAG